MDVGRETPRARIEAACAQHGRASVVACCVDLLAGRDADPELLLALGGRPARWVVTGEPPGPDYWLRVWALRGLLWAWEDDALGSVLTALGDETWRVREMALKVIARHRLDQAWDAVVCLEDDDVARVRAAAKKASRRLVGGDT